MLDSCVVCGFPVTHRVPDQQAVYEKHEMSAKETRTQPVRSLGASLLGIVKGYSFFHRLCLSRSLINNRKKALSITQVRRIVTLLWSGG